MNQPHQAPSQASLQEPASVPGLGLNPDQREALFASSEAFGASPAEAADALLLDVRRAAVYEAALNRIAGSQWRDPAAIESWMTALPTDREIVVYCVHGHEVSRAAVLRLRAAGLNARFLQGGIEAWQTAGMAVEAT